MLYLFAGVAAAGLVLLAGVLAVTLRRVGRTKAAAGSATAGLADRSGLLRARTAALRVAVADRKRFTGSVESEN